MSEVVIGAENLSKQYRIGANGSINTLREAVVNSFSVPFRYFLDTVGRPPAKGADGDLAEGDRIWALKDVSFEVRRGEVVGIIGRNGAGKSTLLKILSRITEPTKGQVEIHGRIGSLLEVGTGFHPELTGRENIYLNGAILGMKKAEIDRKFDEIVTFAEIEKFIDTPVKHYSSGMYVRLAFAVAAHLEPEILLVDEVLAVGDVAFQKKCLGKIGDVAREGRTVLFVSHNMGAVGRLCQRGFWLDEGNLIAQDTIHEVIQLYTGKVLESSAEVFYPEDEANAVQIVGVRLLNHAGKSSAQLDREHPFRVAIDYVVRRKIVGAHVAIMLDTADGTAVCHSGDIDSIQEKVAERHPGRYREIVEFPGGLLNAGAYQIRIGIAKYGGPVYDYCEPFFFHLFDNGTFASAGSGGRQRPGLLAMQLNWKVEKLG